MNEPVSGQRLLGRERELETVEAFLARGNDRVAGLALEGPAGIGKTSLWRVAVAAAERCGWRVLGCRASPEERELGFAGLADLFAGVDPEAVEQLPTAKRAALERALLIGAHPNGIAIDERAVYAAVAEVMRGLAARSPLLVAIDDWRWLDPGTAAALAYTARRLEPAGLRFLLTERSHAAVPERHPLVDALDLDRLHLDPLSDETIALLLHASLRLSLPRRKARRLYELAGGNPLFALELGRAIARQPEDTDGADAMVALPDRLQSVVLDRIRALTPDARRGLLAAALAGAPTARELSELVGEDAVEEALRLDVLVVEGVRVRPVHPLFGEVVRQHSRPSERRELHAAIAARTTDDERRAFHLAEAAPEPDTELARVLAAAAATAAGRAAVAAAVELADRALSLTPDSDPARQERLLELAEYARRAGQLTRAAELLRPVMAEWPPGPARGHARFLFADAAATDIEAGLRAALAEVVEPSSLRARILASLSIHIAVGKCERLSEAEDAAEEGLAIATAHGFEDQRVASVSALAWVRAMRGRQIADLAPETSEIRPDLPVHQNLARIRDVATMWRGELDETRERLAAMRTLADERGEGDSYFIFRLHLCELESRAGRWEVVETLLRGWAQERGESQGDGAAFLRVRALLAAGRGDPDAMSVASEAVRAAEPVLTIWHRLESLRALGLAALVHGDLGTACSSLGQVWAHTRAQGIDNPGAFPVGADLVEALVLHGALDEARAVGEELSRLAEAQTHPWAIAASAYARGHVALGCGDGAGAAIAFADAGERFASLQRRFEQGRALTALGTAERRLRRRRQARRSLETAVALLSDLGSMAWAQKAQDELARIGGRSSSGSALTTTEQRVADLVAQGMANKQVAAALVITVGTVEAHLTRIYAKLGVRSRTDLTRYVLEQ